MDRRIPTLKTERLIIRELTMGDLTDIHRILNTAFGGDMPLESRNRWLQWTVMGYEMFANLGQPHYGERAITRKATGELIGAIGIVPYIDSFGQISAFNGRSDGRATAEVGLFWAIDPAHQGQGYATEAAKKMVYYLTRYEKLHRIIATTGYHNHASQAVMRKIGMTVERAEKPQPPNIFVVGVLDNRSAWQSTFHALIRHPDRPAIWLRQWQTGWGLPRARVPQYVWNSHTEQIAAALQKHLRQQVWVNRLIHFTEDEERRRVEGVYEVELSGTLKAGEWIGRRQLATIPLREDRLRPILDAALVEMESGAVPAARPVWSYPGTVWREAVREWAGRELARLGYGVIGLRQVKHWCISSVLRVKTEGPDFYFKVPARLPMFVQEAVVVQKLAARFPAHVPAPVAIDRERGWMLFRNFEELLSWHSPPPDRAEVMRRFARLQRETAGLTADLLADGVIDRRLDVLEKQIDPLLDDPEAVAGLTAEQLNDLRAQVPLLKQLCRRLATFNIPQTLVHGDLHLGNTARLNGEIVYFDWTDACIAHPFFDLLCLEGEEDAFEREALQSAYLEAWQEWASPAGLREVLAIVDVLLPLHHAISYQQIRAGIKPLAKAELLSPADFLRQVPDRLARYVANGEEIAE